jgi:hypothetical protein
MMNTHTIVADLKTQKRKDNNHADTRNKMSDE